MYRHSSKSSFSDQWPDGPPPIVPDLIEVSLRDGIGLGECLVVTLDPECRGGLYALNEGICCIDCIYERYRDSLGSPLSPHRAYLAVIHPDGCYCVEV